MQNERQIRYWIAALFFLSAVGASLVYLPLSSSRVIKIRKDDRNTHRDLSLFLGLDSMLHRKINKNGHYHHVLRYDVRAARALYFEKPQIRLAFWPFRGMRITLFDLGIIIPICVSGYFLILGKLAKNIEFEDWLWFFVSRALRIFGINFSMADATEVPPPPRSIGKWFSKSRPWIEGFLFILLLLEIAVSLALAKEL